MLGSPPCLQRLCRCIAAAAVDAFSRHSPTCPAFAGLLSANNRLVELGKIVGKFEEIAAEQRGEVKAMVTTAEVRPALASVLHVAHDGSLSAAAGCAAQPQKAAAGLPLAHLAAKHCDAAACATQPACLCCLHHQADACRCTGWCRWRRA